MIRAIANILRQTYVYNTSGEKLELTDILTNEERFIEYLNNQGRNVETNNLNEIDWVFDLYGLIIMSDCDTGLNNSLVISYEEFEGMINSNYIPDAGDPIYGTIRWGTVAF